MWALALGPKGGRNEKEADIIALVRTIVFLSYMTTNLFICAGVIRHWQKAPCFSSIVETSSVEAEGMVHRNDLRPKAVKQFDDLLQARQSNRTPLLSTGQTLDFSRKEIKQVLEDSNGPI
jgi:hypothetical protein